MDNTLFVCDCSDISHQVIVSFDSDPCFNDTIFVCVHLTDVGFWKRVWYSLNYIIGKRSKFGDGAWAEVLLDKQKTAKLIQTLQTHYEEME